MITNLVVRAPIVWLYLHICRPYNIVNFSLDVYMYGGQTIYPNERQLEHFEEPKKNPKYAEMLELVPIEYWEFYAWPIFRRDDETDEQYYIRAALEERKLIRDLQLCYRTSEYDSPHGLNASTGGESSLNSGYKTFIPGETTGLKYISYRKDEKNYRYTKCIWQNGKCTSCKQIFKNKNPFIVYLYAKSLGEKDIIVNKDLFWSNVKKWWNTDIYNVRYHRAYCGIKRVSIRKAPSTKRKFLIVYNTRVEGKPFTMACTLFSKFLQLYQDGVLDINDIFCLDFFCWNAKLVLEGKFDIRNSRPDIFYTDFFEFRKIHHFTVDNLNAAIVFLKEIEAMTDISIPVGQQRLQFN